MLIVGELINTSRKAISESVDNGDAQYIKKIAIEQVEAGADYLDVNCGTKVFREKETMEWLINTIQEVVQVPLCIDSPNSEVLEAGLALCKYGQPMINSITDEKERFQKVIPLVSKYKAKIIALCMDDTGIPETADGRMRILKSLYVNLQASGVPDYDMYVDPLVMPISSVETAGMEVLDTIKAIKTEYPNVHFMCGLSNVSYGLPNRKTLNRLFVVQTMTLGMDGYILNPTDRGMMGTIFATQALMGQDSYCMRYLSAHRTGLYEEQQKS
ncbi:methyltetrahydrofolate cobalamin methyltransferase [Desulfosporosinus sp. BICA1-9]|uniref:methyltetrahydrofolate cobalamin methyltransferase n=1 Tax=Desulfosporosinus sp. BICA1-9 TaxID=1531958 RepID=UPI00054C7004|nr:methyltetrahydrofolate cobalamin methyltransferase [Desulfosporosinus sp. BICA1-9]KJS48993.1 MAG: methyltetrahydrofolate:corrinoid methyltransferase [Peptococcaceae bacterium BRH_c23]KJS78078.1 MAG: methyltetrahydrofolate:corrinoid methyltransferase [Desulfosporosinus sp. BICA1-9]HBW34132.1 methyltetrahydrofolate cobalamin methyltransferase [Desulfosporosinus sp.]